MTGWNNGSGHTAARCGLEHGEGFTGEGPSPTPTSADPREARGDRSGSRLVSFPDGDETIGERRVHVELVDNPALEALRRLGATLGEEAADFEAHPVPFEFDGDADTVRVVATHEPTVLTHCEGCGIAVDPLIAKKMAGFCWGCGNPRMRARFEEIDIAVEGRLIRAKRLSRSPAERERRRIERKRYKSKPEVKDRASTLKNAERRAKSRLARIYPELYELLLADERGRAGLEPWSPDRLMSGLEARLTLGVLMTYASDDADRPD